MKFKEQRIALVLGNGDLHRIHQMAGNSLVCGVCDSSARHGPGDDGDLHACADGLRIIDEPGGSRPGSAKLIVGVLTEKWTRQMSE